MPKGWTPIFLNSPCPFFITAVALGSLVTTPLRTPLFQCKQELEYSINIFCQYLSFYCCIWLCLSQAVGLSDQRWASEISQLSPISLHTIKLHLPLFNNTISKILLWTEKAVIELRNNQNKHLRKSTILYFKIAMDCLVALVSCLVRFGVKGSQVANTTGTFEILFIWKIFRAIYCISFLYIVKLFFESVGIFLFASNN